ncbi:Ferric reductase NAD binding domain containing protein [Hyaloscypha variabilis]
MPGMTMTGSAPSSTTIISDPLSTAGLNMGNGSVQMDFLTALLDDTELQVISNFYARSFWFGTIVVIGIATLLNLFLRSAASNVKIDQDVAPYPRSHVMRAIISISRKISPPSRNCSPSVDLPSFVLALEFVEQEIPGEQHNQAIGVRAGWLTITQLPLLILLSVKVNFIGLVTGVSYERLNVVHRWVARTMFLTATLHMGYQQVLWNQLGLLQLEWNTDTCPPTGIKAYAFLAWLNLSNLAPIRNLWYEFFVIQHILTFFGFIICIMLHLPSTALYSRVYIWIPIGIYLLERTLRTLRYVYNNIRPGRATLLHLPGGSWTPGSFVLLSLPRFGIGQSHPATIASIPTSHEGQLVFFLRAHHGFTSRIHANASTVSLHKATAFPEPPPAPKSTHLALIDGPYGGKQLDFASFGSVLLISGSTGVTFTLPILLDIAFRTQKHKLPVKEVTFIWTIKTSDCATWIDSELENASDELAKAGIVFTIKIFVTADEEFVETAKSSAGSSPSIGAKTLVGETETQDGDKVVEGEKLRDELPAHSARRLELSMQTGRPNLNSIIAEAQKKGQEHGEMGVAVCGPVGLTAETRRVVTRLKGKGREIYLHAESFGW